MHIEHIGNTITYSGVASPTTHTPAPYIGGGLCPPNPTSPPRGGCVPRDPSAVYEGASPLKLPFFNNGTWGIWEGLRDLGFPGAPRVT